MMKENHCRAGLKYQPHEQQRTDWSWQKHCQEKVLQQYEVVLVQKLPNIDASNKSKLCEYKYGKNQSVRSFINKSVMDRGIMNLPTADRRTSSASQWSMFPCEKTNCVSSPLTAPESMKPRQEDIVDSGKIKVETYGTKWHHLDNDSNQKQKDSQQVDVNKS